MVDQIIRPADLPTERVAPNASEWLVVDNDVTVAKSTIENVVHAGRPAASQAEAEAGLNSVKAMTPLTTKQAIEAQGDVRFASAVQGALADSATQPGDLATVATTGVYADLTGKPTLGTAAAAAVTDFATFAQGALADTALQSIVPGSNVSVDDTDPLNPVISASSGGGALVESLVDLKALDPSAESVFLSASGMWGQFIWFSGDFSTQIAVDTSSGVFAKANSVPATSGAWVRQYDGPMIATWFGTSSLQTAINVAEMLGDSLFLGGFGVTHTITSGISIPAGVTVFSRLVGGAGAKIDASNGNYKAVTMGPGAKLIGVEVQGPGNDAYNADSFGVYQTGTNNSPAAPTYVTGPVIENCYIHGFRNAGIELDYVDGFSIQDNKIENCGYAGISCVSVRNGRVDLVNVTDVSPGSDGNAYGMFFSKFNGSDTAYPNSENVSITRCIVKDVPLWHAFDTHGGRHIVFEDCEAHNCYRAFILTYATNVTGAYGPRYSGFRRCKALTPPPTLSARGEGFWIHGAYNGSDVIQDYAIGCFIEDCEFDGYGYERTGGSPVTLGCGYVKGTRNATVRGNAFKECVGDALHFVKDNVDFSIIGNDGLDWRSERVNPAFFRAAGSINSGLIVSNIGRRWNGSLGTYTAELGIRTDASLSSLVISYGSNRMDCTTPVQALTAASAYYNT